MTKRGQVPVVAMFALAVLGTPLAQAQTYKVLHSFTGPDGSKPRAALIADPAGDLFGTASGGGAFNDGTVFKVDKTGLTVLHSFRGPDGAGPWASLLRDPGGYLYGTTQSGGIEEDGTVFKLDPNGTETVLYGFKNSTLDGKYPLNNLIQDSAGNLYSTTEEGGESGVLGGVVFELGKAAYQVLYDFESGGGIPNGLIRDSAGNLYGTTQNGGTFDYGVVFKLDSAGTETVLYNFAGGADGANPLAGVIQDSAGNFYGTTGGGGGASNCGTVFKLDSTGTETVLYSFSGAAAEGCGPHAGVVLDPEGNLYGTTNEGGAPKTGIGYGVVFKIDTTGAETILHSFTGGADGGYPLAGLFLDSAGNLYGTASAGGIVNSACPTGCGVVFKIEP